MHDRASRELYFRLSINIDVELLDETLDLLIGCLPLLPSRLVHCRDSEKRNRVISAELAIPRSRCPVTAIFGASNGVTPLLKRQVGRHFCVPTIGNVNHVNYGVYLIGYAERERRA